MESYVMYIWLGLMVVLVAIEAATINLTTIWFALGSLISFILSLFGLQLWFQISIFLFSSIMFIIFTRPVAVKYFKIGTEKTNLDSLIGQKGIVIMDIEEFKTGQVRLKGQVWTAISKSGIPIRKDSEVTVDAIEGVKLIVTEIK